MAAESRTARNYIQLHYRQKNSGVMVTPHERDRFVVTVQEAINACSSAEQTCRYVRQFDGLLTKLETWLKQNQAKVERAFLTVREGGLLFLVVRREVECDPEFTDELTRLDVAIASDDAFDAIQLDVLALPNVPERVAKSFLSLDRQKELAGAQGK